MVLDGGVAWARGAVQEEVGCGAATLKKAVVGGPAMEKSSGAVFLEVVKH